MIQRLMVRDWGPYAEKSVSFSEGKNVILGSNFSGKTSLVNAIFYALTGEALIPKGKTKAADFAKAASRDSIVELDIKVGDGEYRIRRRPTRKQSHLLKMQGGQEVSEIASGPGVDLRVAQVLGFGTAELTQAVFMKEGAVAEYLADTTPDKRKKFVKAIEYK